MFHNRKSVKSVFGFVLFCFITSLTARNAPYRTRAMTSGEFEKFKAFTGTYEEGRNYNVIINGHGTGLKPPSEAQWEQLRDQPILVEPLVLAAPPSSVDYSTDNAFPPIGNQGSKGSCTAWAVGYYIKTFQEAYEHGWNLSGSSWPGIYGGVDPNLDHVFSPDFIYHQINDGVDQGSTPYDAMHLLQRIGCSSWEEMPVDYNDSTTWPSEDAWREAALYRSKIDDPAEGYNVINLNAVGGLTTLKQVIADGSLAAISMDATFFWGHFLDANDLLSLNNYTSEYMETNHCNAIVGYDDNYGPYTEQGNPHTYGAFKVANSWDTGSWENVADGFYFISYECMKQRIQYAYYYENEIGYNPSLLSLFYLTHDTTRADIEITVGLGDPDSPERTKRFDDYIYKGGSGHYLHHFPTHLMAMDISEFELLMDPVGANQFFLGIYDLSSNDGGIDNYPEGRIDAFFVERYDDYLSGTPTETYTSTDPYPVAMRDGSNVYARVIDRQTINVYPQTSEISFHETDVTLTVNTQSSEAMYWTATLPNGETWLSFSSATTGVGNGTVTLHVDENTDVGSDRSATVRLSSAQAENSPFDVTINQARAEYSISVTPSSINVPWQAVTRTLNVVIDGSQTFTWEASRNGSFFHFTGDSTGTGNSSFGIAFDVNTSTLSGRSGSIDITCADVENSPVSVTVNQENASYVLSVTPGDQDVSWIAGQKTFNVNLTGPTAEDWHAIRYSGADWLHFTGDSSGTASGSITVAYDQNTSQTQARTGIIHVIADSAANSPYGIYFNQGAMSGDALLVIPMDTTIAAAGGTLEYIIKSSTGTPLTWSASIRSGSWLHFLESPSGTTRDTLHVSVDPWSDTVNSRRDTIVFTAPGAPNSPLNVVVTQLRAAYTLLVSPASANAGWQAGTGNLSVEITGPTAVNWTASASSTGSWLSIISGATGTQQGTITYQYTENSSLINSRSGTIEIQCAAASNSPVEVNILQSQMTQFFKVMTGEIVNDSDFSQGVAWGDYDSDGDQDVFVTNGNDVNSKSNYIYSNNNNGTFTKIALETGTSFGATWGDYDNDGDLDLYVANYGTNFLYENQGGGVMERVTSGTITTDAGFSRGCAWADYDRDGFIDLFVANYSNQNNFLYHNNRNGSFTRITSGPVVTDGGDSRGCAWADYDLDGYPDLFVANYNNQNNFLYHNEGNGTFTKVVMGVIVNDGEKSQGGSWGDYDNDGWPDLFVTNRPEQNNMLYHNLGDGDFEKIGEGDIANDGGSSFGSAWADYNRDGWLDLLVTNRPDQANFLYKNNGNGTFAGITGEEIVTNITSSYGAAWCDFDEDGDVDILIANYDQKNGLYTNNEYSNHWLSVRCVGVASNKTALGARVRVKANINGTPVWQMQEISGQTGYLGQNSMVLYFGLGNASTVDSLEVHWPSGLYSVQTGIARDQLITVTEFANLPVAVNDLASTLDGVAVTINPLLNDTDADGDPLLLETIYSEPKHGSAVILSGDTQILYTPAAGFIGTDTLSYVVIDGKSGRDTALVEISMTEKPNTAPVAADDAASTMDGVAVTISVLANDTDPDGNPLTVYSVNTDGTTGEVEIDDGSQTLTYTPPLGFTGTDTFAYTVSDGRGGSDTGQVTVTVSRRPNYEPVAVDDTSSVTYPNSLVIHVLMNDSDPDGDALIVQSLNVSATNGTVLINTGDTTLTYVPKLGFSGFDTFRYRITDSRGGLDSAQVRITVKQPGTEPEQPVTGVDERALPETFYLAQNYPNPFNPETEIVYELPEKCDVTVQIFSLLGQRVRTLVRESQDPGYYSVKWRAVNDGGDDLPSGLYFIHIQAGTYRAIRKMTLLR